VADSRGNQSLRGHPGSVPVYAVRADLGLQRAAMPTRRLIGREDERARLMALLEASRRDGTGRVAVVLGDAGIGKSRLLADMETDARQAGFRWTIVENVSYGTGEPYRFLRAFAQAIADEEGTDSGSLARSLLFGDDLDPEQAQRIGGAIAAVAREAAFSGWEAEAPFAPTEPSDVQAAVLEASLRYIERLAAVLGPRVIIIDDLHWADRSSLPTLELLVRTAPTVPFVLLFGSRPIRLPDWLTGSDVDRIDLAGLDEPEVGALASDVAGAALASEDARLVHERTAGNPLFVSETVRAMLDDGVLELRDGLARRVDGRAAMPLPVTLRALLGARIDALPESAREIVGVASVVGVAFNRQLVEVLIGNPIDAASLDQLADGALIVPTDESSSWRFAHDLIRDVAYAGLLAGRRRSLHSRLADLYELEPLAGIGRAAIHRAAAGDTERALPLLADAARSASAVGAVAEAAGFWRTAAGLVSADDPRRAEYARLAEETLRSG
jgi:predicted ATPase